jgi:hypothetical protein
MSATLSEFVPLCGIVDSFIEAMNYYEELIGPSIQGEIAVIPKAGQA